MWGTVDGPQKWMIDDDLFRKFCVLIHDITGLSYGETSRFFLERRLETRISALGGMTPYNYLQFLQYDADRAQEWDLLIAVITTNETYFMREERQLRCFQKDILPKLGDRGGQKIRIWSAGCSSGEEPYTIAILIKELGRIPDDLIEIYATDINSKVLAKAKAGLYTESSFRAVDKDFKDRWFTTETSGQYKVRDTVQKMVTFARFNLFDESRYSLLSPFDVIFCRNVIIYFDLEAKVKVVERFHDKLRSGGYLLLGHSESLISVTDKFKLIHLPLDLVYTKAAP
jgi:chemotaxis protein methyltransferase CheR